MKGMARIMTANTAARASQRSGSIAKYAKTVEIADSALMTSMRLLEGGA